MFKVSAYEGGFCVTMSATLEHLEDAVGAVTGFLTSRDLGEATFASLLVLREGLTNAVLHGCRLDPTCNIRIRVCMEDEFLEYTIEDDGPGFDWQGRESEPPGLDSPRGRGIAIMRAYFDEITYNAQGNALTLRKHRPLGSSHD